MKITPLEIRQKTFEKEFRGYHKEEVHAFLHTLSLEWEKLVNELKDSSRQVEVLEREVSKLKEVESSLYKTLKTAEDTGANMIDQANKMAEIHMKETEVRAEAILNDAKNRAHDAIEEAEMVARDTIEDMEDHLKNILHSYKTLENFRDDLISDIKSLSNDALERVERLRNQSKKVDVDELFMKARRESKKTIDRKTPANIEKNEDKQADKPTARPDEVIHANKDRQQNTSIEEKNANENLGDRSFFDEIE